MHNDLLAVRELVYDKYDYHYTAPEMEAEGAEYGAYTFKLNELLVRFRVAKITPTKVGQFVTLWKRSEEGPIVPYDLSDPADLYVISTRKGHHFGQFVFPKAVLCERGILSNNNNGGKRAIRVYPPWDITTSGQAQKTQRWQSEYFLAITGDGEMDAVRLKKLYGAAG